MIRSHSFKISVGILSLAIISVFLIGTRGTVEVSEKRLDELPFQIGQWNGYDIPMEKRIIDGLNTDVYINRMYSLSGSSSRTIGLYIGYYGTEKGGRTGHNPNSCLPSQGWALIQEKKVPIQVLLDNQKEKAIFLNRLLVKLSESKKIVYHWYQSSGDTVLSSGTDQNVNRFWKRIIFNRNDGAFIQVTIIIHKNPKTADEFIQKFIRALFPLVVKHWPIEKERES